MWAERGWPNSSPHYCTAVRVCVCVCVAGGLSVGRVEPPNRHGKPAITITLSPGPTERPWQSRHSWVKDSEARTRLSSYRLISNILIVLLAEPKTTQNRSFAIVECSPDGAVGLRIPNPSRIDDNSLRVLVTLGIISSVHLRIVRDLPELG